MTHVVILTTTNVKRNNGTRHNRNANGCDGSSPCSCSTTAMQMDVTIGLRLGGAPGGAEPELEHVELWKADGATRALKKSFGSHETPPLVAGAGDGATRLLRLRMHQTGPH